MRQADCDFCLRLHNNVPERPWYDFLVLDQQAAFCTVLALGALTPGHIMIVSRHHYDCMADLSSETIDQLGELVNYWMHITAKAWTAPCFLFEHGGSSEKYPSGACIMHAHLQILPLAADPIGGSVETQTFSSLSEALTYARGASYLLYAWEGRFRVAKDRLFPGQFLRRKIANGLGRHDEWDYLMFPNYANMRIGRDRLTGYLDYGQNRVSEQFRSYLPRLKGRDPRLRWSGVERRFGLARKSPDGGGMVLHSAEPAAD